MQPPATPEPVQSVAQPLADEAKVGSRVVKHHGLRLALVFVCIALPLWAFGQIALEVIEGQPLAIDTAILQAQFDWVGTNMPELAQRIVDQAQDLYGQGAAAEAAFAERGIL